MLSELFRKLYLMTSKRDKPSPLDRVKREQITYDKPSGVLKVQFKPGEDIRIFNVANSKSMDGIMDGASNVIATGDFDHSELQVGDIGIYQSWTTLIVHEIIKITKDIHGRWYKFRGTNNPYADRALVRDVQVKYVRIGQFD